jgi:hypothetical protein
LLREPCGVAALGIEEIDGWYTITPMVGSFFSSKGITDAE